MKIEINFKHPYMDAKIIEELTQKLNIVADMQGNIERIRDAVTTHRYETDDP